MHVPPTISCQYHIGIISALLLQILQAEWNHTMGLHLHTRTIPSHAAQKALMRLYKGLSAIAQGLHNPFEDPEKVGTWLKVT